MEVETLAVRKPLTIRRFVTVSNISALPCSQSTLASVSPNAVLATIPLGIVAATKRSKKANPNWPRAGVRSPRKPRKYKKER